MNRYLRSTLAVSVMLLAMLLIYSGGRILIAGLSDYQAMLFQTSWEKSNQPPKNMAWLVARDAALKANDWFPYVANGSYLERLGRIYEWQYSDLPFRSVIAAASRAKAIDTLSQAIEARRPWPYNYVVLAYVKFKQLAFDQQFASAFANAHQYGPWRRRIQFPLARLGIMAWPALNDEQRQQTRENFARVLQMGYKAQEVIDLANQSDLADQLCVGFNPANLRLQRYCQAK